ncbi:MAG: hypothetical protein A2341_08760 [Deltaproteobacteria bacterium RIFOXYB12_FULL_58_9]|nr:MAG: hypothetical protein A2341_08760 [Deltaproteobacteria bacterium RIFOXYB12_FULL_58_9]
MARIAVNHPIHQEFLDYHGAIEAEMGEPISISGLTGPLRIFQRVNGHRHSIDDAMTAWYALQKCAQPESCLDLGTGVGTVGMIVLWGLPSHTTMTCIEAQESSYTLLCANIKCNHLSQRVTTIHGDLRNLDLGQKFSLVTGSPPYFPKNAGPFPKDTQKTYARFELRGHVGDYAEAARRHLHPDGLFVYCFPHQQRKRGIDLVTQAGFRIVSYRDIIPTRTSKTLFSVFAARLQHHGHTIEDPPLIVRGDDGHYTAEMLEIQKTRGFG